MAVQFSGANGRASTVQNLYTQLHTLLLAAGWELVYADADAIGTGSAGTPAWDKTPVAGASAGIAVYRMPLVSGYPTRWCLQLNPRWATGAVAAQLLQVQIATAATSGGVLTNPGTVQQITNGTATASNTASTEWYIIAYEHGLLIGLHATLSGWLYCAERRRRLDGTVLDDLNVYASSVNANGANVTLGGVTYNNGLSQSRTATQGEITTQRWAVFAASDGSVPYTLNRMDGATGIPQGPINVSGGTSGVPRLFAFLPTNDVTLGVDSTLNVDGQDRAYLPASTSTVMGSGATLTPRVVYAKE
ncbi:hypothetical protein [Deinococcus enclensis]|uniref:Uncharacterized protein n=1 Tax=Deinococcus enclensis TaxID=1049582 RepID=A0ABT9MB82_9DEIO|nr:hypothetical protein [Deinococcus enclensis]MDP9763833.1 hypothetical protein [Deinococcus enclensis]